MKKFFLQIYGATNVFLSLGLSRFSVIGTTSNQGLDIVILCMAKQIPVEDITLTSCLAGVQAWAQGTFLQTLHHPNKALAYIWWAFE